MTIFPPPRFLLEGYLEDLLASWGLFIYLFILEYKKMQQNESVIHIHRSTLFTILFHVDH